MFRFIALVAILLPALAMAGRVSISACNGGGHMPNWVAIEGCDESSCTIRRNTPVVVSGEVNTITDSETLLVSLHAVILGASIPLTLPPEVQDGCKVVPSGCPLKAGQLVPISAAPVIEVPDLAVGMTFPVELSVTNQDKTIVFCVRTPVTVIA